MHWMMARAKTPRLQYPRALQVGQQSSYEELDASLIKWQRGMSSLFKDIVDTTPAGEISDSSLEFKFDGDSRRYMRSECSAHLILSAHSDWLLWQPQSSLYSCTWIVKSTSSGSSVREAGTACLASGSREFAGLAPSDAMVVQVML